MNSTQPQEKEVPSKSAKLVQIIDDTVQILIDDNELMRDDDDYKEDNDGTNEINAEEIIYDVLKVLEDCNDPELCLEMIVPIIGALQKYIINLGDSPNLFLIQLFLHLLQTCLSGIKGEYILPKSIVQHLLEVIIEKVPQDNSILVEKLFLLGAVIQNCTPKEVAQMNFLCKQFLVPLLKQEISTEVVEAAAGCITDCSSSFKSEFQQERELIQLLIQKLKRSLSNAKEAEALFNSMGDAALAGGLTQEDIQDVFKIVDQYIKSPKKVQLTVRMSLIQMHTCMFNSFSDDQNSFLNSIIPYVKLIISFVISTLDEEEDQITKQQLKELLSLLLDIGVLYGKSEFFQVLKDQIWSSQSKVYFKKLKQILLENEDNKTLLYFENVLLKIFEVDYGTI